MSSTDPSAFRVSARFSAAVARRFDQQRCMQVAGGLTFTTLLSLVPLFAVALAASAASPLFDQWIEALQEFLSRNFLPDSGRRMIGLQLAQFTENAAQLTAIGLVFLIVTVLSLMLSIEETFNSSFQVSRPRPFARRLLLYLLVLALGPLLIGAGLSMTSWLVGQSLGLLQEHGRAPPGVLRALPYGLTCLALTLFYLLTPSHRVQFTHALAGGADRGSRIRTRQAWVRPLHQPFSDPYDELRCVRGDPDLSPLDLHLLARGVARRDDYRGSACVRRATLGPGLRQNRGCGHGRTACTTRRVFDHVCVI